MNWSDVCQWRSSGLDPAIDDLIAARHQAMTCGEIVDAMDLTTEWSGAGAREAEQRREDLESRSERLLAAIDELLRVTSRAQNGVGEVELLVHEAQSRMDFNGFTVSDPGVVTDPNPISQGMTDKLANDEPVRGAEGIERWLRLVETRAAVRAALEQARVVSEVYEDALKRIVGEDFVVIRDVNDLATSPSLPLPWVSTEQVSAWWHSLTEDEQDRLIETHYRVIGNLDGVEGWARNEANRRAVQEDLDYYREFAEDAQARWEAGEYLFPPEKEREYLGRYTDAQLAMKALEQAEDQGQQAQLLLYDPPRPGEDRMARMAVAVGNVDTAEHVSTFVPGMSTTPGNMPGMVDNMVQLKDAAESKNAGSVATIAWLGYDAPSAPWDTLEFDVASTGSAKAGGESLASFVEGLDDSRSGETSMHQTVLGHSYGSTTASYAMSQVRPGVVDGFAVFGSPGVVNGSWDMNVPQDRLYAMQLDRDIIRHANNVGGFFKDQILEQRTSATAGTLGMAARRNESWRM